MSHFEPSALGAVHSEMITFPSGYAYEFTPGPKHELVQKIASRDLTPHRDAIQWALDNCAEKSAADLELLSTIVYADREASQARRQMAFEELGRKVKQGKSNHGFPRRRFCVTSTNWRATECWWLARHTPAGGARSFWIDSRTFHYVPVWPVWPV